MSYNDPNTSNRRDGVGQPTSNTGWMVVTIAVLAAAFVIISMYRHNGNYDPSVMNNPAVPTITTDSGTTGSATPIAPTSR